MQEVEIRTGYAVQTSFSAFFASLVLMPAEFFGGTMVVRFRPWGT